MDKMSGHLKLFKRGANWRMSWHHNTDLPVQLDCGDVKSIKHVDSHPAEEFVLSCWSPKESSKMEEKQDGCPRFQKTHTSIFPSSSLKHFQSSNGWTVNKTTWEQPMLTISAGLKNQLCTLTKFCSNFIGSKQSVSPAASTVSTLLES